MVRGLIILIILAMLGIWKPLVALILLVILGAALFRGLTRPVGY